MIDVEHIKKVVSVDVAPISRHKSSSDYGG